MLLAACTDPSLPQRVGPVEGCTLVHWEPAQSAPPGPVEVMIPEPFPQPATVLAAMELPSVRLVQLLSAGYDGIPELLRSDVRLCNAAGVHDASTAELTVGLMIAAQRGIPEAVRAQAEGRWLPLERLPSLADRRVLLVGYGSVGRAIAQRLRPFEVDLTAVASRPRPGDDLVEQVHGIDALPRLLPRAEIVVVVVPLLPETTGLVGEGFLAALPDGALVVNVARGPVADTAAVLRHAGRLRFALDVTDPEPLPDGHPLFTAPGVLITPHRGGASSAFHPRATAFLRAQLSRLGRGEKPHHIVHG